MSILKKSLGLIGFLAILIAAQIGFAQPSIAPTAEVKILGASQNEQSEINNFHTFNAQDLTKDQGSNIRATSYLVQKVGSDNYLQAKRIDNPLPIASLTKLMTTWTVLQYGELNDVYTIQNSDRESISPILGLKVGDRIKVRDLVNSVLIGSANDGALALSHYVEQRQNAKLGTSLTFVELMNLQARELNLTNTRFSNPIGFDNVANYSSAYDISVLVNKLKPTGVLDLAERSSSYQFTSEAGLNYRIEATNKLISSYPDIYAIKTGFTNQALGSMVTWIEKDGQRYLVIVIGSPDRETDTLSLRSQL